MPSVCNMLLFNSKDNPFKEVRPTVTVHLCLKGLPASRGCLSMWWLVQYKTLDNLAGFGRQVAEEKETEEKLAPAPQGLRAGQGAVRSNRVFADVCVPYLDVQLLVCCMVCGREYVRVRVCWRRLVQVAWTSTSSRR